MTRLNKIRVVVVVLWLLTVAATVVALVGVAVGAPDLAVTGVVVGVAVILLATTYLSTRSL